MKQRLAVFIVEDDPRTLRHLVALLEGEPSLSVVGAVRTVDEALAQLPGAQADVALVDLGLPGRSGVELIEALRGGLPVLVYTVHEDRSAVLGALKAGASGYVLKGSTPRELVEAIHNLHGGGAPMSPKIARAVLRELQRPPDQPDLLTPRERQVLSRIDRGLSYKEVAAELHISINTVHSHVKHIYERLQATDKRSVLVAARRRGLL